MTPAKPPKSTRGTLRAAKSPTKRATKKAGRQGATKRGATKRGATKLGASAKRAAAAKRGASTKRGATKRPATKRPATKPRAPGRSARKAARKAAPSRRRARSAGSKNEPATKRVANGEARWSRFVEQHGVVLASAKGPVPSVAEAIAGEPIIGSWWSHPRAQAIFDALSAIDDSNDIRCFKLVDHKITFVHRRLWPALAKLAQAGVLGADRVESIQQEHMPTGEHRNFTTPFPDWVPEEAARDADALSVEEARAQLGSWLTGTG